MDRAAANRWRVGYREGGLALADDLQEADGSTVLDFSQAQVAARQWWLNEQRIAQGMSVPTKGPYTLKRACADYLEDYRRRGGEAAEIISYAFDAHVLAELANMAVTKLTARQLQNWRRAIAERPRRLRTRPNAEQRYAALDRDDPDAVRRRRATANRVLTFPKAALNQAWRAGCVPSDEAWRGVKPFRSVDAPVIRYLTPDEITRLLNVCQGSFRDLVHAALLTGARYCELCRLKEVDYNRDVGGLTIRLSKGGKVRHVTLTEEGPEQIERLVAGRSSDQDIFRRDDGSTWKKSFQKRPMKAACTKAGITPAVSFHILQHTHGSHLAMAGVPMAVIAKQLGHADTRMTESHYAHLAPNYVADTIRKNFPPSDSPGTPVRRAIEARSGGMRAEPLFRPEDPLGLPIGRHRPSLRKSGLFAQLTVPGFAMLNRLCAISCTK